MPPEDVRLVEEVVRPQNLVHAYQRRIDSGARLFGVEVLHHLGGSLDVSEQGSACLALALQAFGLSLPKILWEPEFERLRELVELMQFRWAGDGWVEWMWRIVYK